MKRAASLRLVLDFCRAHGTAEVRVAAEQLEPRQRVKAAKFSERGYTFADWFRSTLAPEVRLAVKWRDAWAQCFDMMLLLDERTPEQIAAVCKWARAHAFWGQHFQTPLKLRQRKDGTMYFDRFSEAMKAAGNVPAKRVQPVGYKNATTTGPVVVSASELLRGGA